MTHTQPCRHGFLATPCPECRDRLELQHRIIDADTKGLLREFAEWFLDHDRNAAREALDCAEASA